MLDFAMNNRARRSSNKSPHRYRAPLDVRETLLPDLLEASGRGALKDRQLDLLRSQGSTSKHVQLYFSGDLSLIDKPSVAIVGSRAVSNAGRLRASRLARELINSGFVVVSGLAAGVDSAAHRAAIESGGSTIAVIGTPLERAYPAENAALQEEIYRNHLLVSPFSAGERTYRSSFPKRNRVMAAITDATVIVEASDTSGSLHQAAECVRLGRWLFIAKSLVDNRDLTWPEKFLRVGGKTAVLTKTSDLVRAVLSERP